MKIFILSLNAFVKTHIYIYLRDEYIHIKTFLIRNDLFDYTLSSVLFFEDQRHVFYSKI